MPGDIGWFQALSSLALIAIVLVISRWRRLGIEQSLLWSSIRALVQLVAVGLLFGVIFDTPLAMTWSWIWVAVMTIVSMEVVTRRTGRLPGMRLISLAALAGSVAVTLLVVFGLGVLHMEPVTVVVISGLTLGNTLPAAVQAADLIATDLMEKPHLIEGLLSLGFDRREATREVTRSAIRQALIPHIERTKVIGLIALPGTMAGMLLAGADPLPAVLVQLVIVYLVLGAVGVGAVVVALSVAGKALTPGLRLAPWVAGR